MTTPRHTVRLRGRFVFASHREFNDAVDAALKTSEPNVIIDLSDTVYIDSAALGMLLLARHRAEQLGKTITLKGAEGTVLQVLQIANFDRLFTVT